MTGPLFDQSALALRRKRAERLGPDLFIHDRAFEEMLERLAVIRRPFHSALTVGWPVNHWRSRLEGRVATVTGVDDQFAFSRLSPGQFDLCVAIGFLDTVDDLPLALTLLRHALAPDGLLIGVLPGGETLPRLRAAMRAADERIGAAAPHVHPRIEAGALAMLLTRAQFIDPVVDVERIDVSYRDLDALVRDLRRMAATNVLSARSRSAISADARAAAVRAFAADAGHRTVETFELLHFAAWTPRISPHG